MVRQPKALRISFRSEEGRSFFWHSSRAPKITADFILSTLHIIAVRSGFASNEWRNVSRTEFHRCKRSLKGFFVEYTSRTSNELREMESGFKVLLPPKLNSFNIKRQAKLTHDQAKHLHFYIPTTRGLEADKTVDALNRLDLTDAHVEQILTDSQAGAPCQSWSCASQQPCAGVSDGSSNYHVKRVEPQPQPQNIGHREISWIVFLKELMMTVIPWWTKNGSTLVSFSTLQIIAVRSGFASNEWRNVSKTEFHRCKRFEHVAT